MEYVRLGQCGLQVSRLTLGAMGVGDPRWRSWVLDFDVAKPIVKTAFDAGINVIDTCDFYSAGSSEEAVGKLFKGFLNRNEAVIATKFGMPMGKDVNARGYSRKHALDAVDASLKRLGTDRIDLLQTHIWDPATSIEELVEVLDLLVSSGRVLYVGATDMPTWQFAKAVYYAKYNGLSRFVSMQSHYNLVWREDEREMFPFCSAEGIGVMPYSPIARGFLSGTARRAGTGATERARTDSYAKEWYGRPADERVAEAVEEVAKSRGLSPSQVALAWVLRSPYVHSPVIGPTQVEHVREAVEAVEINLEPDEISKLEAFYAPRFTSAHR